MAIFEELKTRYNVLVSETLERNKQTIIDSLVDYYGENHRNTIEHRYNDIVYAYYIDWETIDFIMKDYITPLNKSEYQSIVDLSNSREKKQSKLKKFFSWNNETRKDMPDNFIGITNESLLDNPRCKREIIDCCRTGDPLSTSLGDHTNPYRIVSFQVLPLPVDAIIHEINHSITRFNLSYYVDKRKLTNIIRKTGISVTISSIKSDEVIMEELLNDKTALEITDIFKKKGGDLTPFCKDIPFVFPYRKNFYLIDDFYNEFKSYIKEARITENKNILVNKVGKENYEELRNLITEYYTNDIDKIEEIKKEAEPKVKKLIEKMKLHASNTRKITKEELEDYYNSLRREGKTVTILNEFEPYISNEDKPKSL